MSNIFIVHTSGSSTNGGGYTDSYTGNWSDWHNGGFSPAFSGTNAVFDFEIKTVTKTGIGSASSIGLLSYVNGAKVVEDYYEITDIIDDDTVEILGIVSDADDPSADNPSDGDYLDITINVGGAVDTVDDAALMASSDGDEILITTSSTEQTIHTVTTSYLTFADAFIEIKGVDETDGSILSFNRFQDADVQGNILPRLSLSDYIYFGEHNYIRGLMIVGMGTSTGYIVNHGWIRVFTMHQCHVINTYSGGCLNIHRWTAYDCRCENSTTGQGNVAQVSDGLMCDIVAISHSDMSDYIINLNYGYEFWHLSKGLVIINKASTKNNVMGINVGMSAYYGNSLINSTIVNCATAINFKTFATQKSHGVIGNNIAYNCTNVYSLDGTDESLVKQLAYDSNAYNGTRNISADAYDVGTDIILTADPFNDSANDDYTLNIDGPQFSSLYNEDTGVLVGALGPSPISTETLGSRVVTTFF